MRCDHTIQKLGASAPIHPAFFYLSKFLSNLSIYNKTRYYHRQLRHQLPNGDKEGREVKSLSPNLKKRDNFREK